MNRTKLANLIAIESGVSRREATRWIDEVLKGVSKALQDSGKVRLSGFGTFEVRQRCERRGRNPHTGHELLLPPRKVVAFKSSPCLRSLLDFDDKADGGLDMGPVSTR